MRGQKIAKRLARANLRSLVNESVISARTIYWNREIERKKWKKGLKPTITLFLLQSFGLNSGFLMREVALKPPKVALRHLG